MSSEQLYGVLLSVQTAVHEPAPAAERWIVTVETAPPGSVAVALSETVARSGVPGSSIVTCGPTQSAAPTIELPGLTVVAVNAPQTLPLARAEQRQQRGAAAPPSG